MWQPLLPREIAVCFLFLLSFLEVNSRLGRTTLGHFLLGTFYFLDFPFIFFGFVVRFVAPSDTFHVAKQTNDNCARLFIVYQFLGYCTRH